MRLVKLLVELLAIDERFLGHLCKRAAAAKVCHHAADAGFY